MYAVLPYIEEQLAAIERAPEMFGSLLAVEVQYIMLLEIRAVAQYPERLTKEPRFVRDLWNRFNQEREQEFSRFDPLQNYPQLIRLLKEFQSALDVLLKAFP